MVRRELLAQISFLASKRMHCLVVKGQCPRRNAGGAGMRPTGYVVPAFALLRCGTFSARVRFVGVTQFVKSLGRCGLPSCVHGFSPGVCKGSIQAADVAPYTRTRTCLMLAMSVLCFRVFCFHKDICEDEAFEMMCALLLPPIASAPRISAYKHQRWARSHYEP